MNAQTSCVAAETVLTERSATIEYVKTWFERPLDWELRCVGPSVGGYGTLTGKTPAKYASREDAERAARIWIATGVTPAFQNGELSL